jgi:hypothetical protein
MHGFQHHHSLDVLSHSSICLLTGVQLQSPYRSQCMTLTCSKCLGVRLSLSQSVACLIHAIVNLPLRQLCRSQGPTRRDSSANTTVSMQHRRARSDLSSTCFHRKCRYPVALQRSSQSLQLYGGHTPLRLVEQCTPLTRHVFVVQ